MYCLIAIMLKLINIIEYYVVIKSDNRAILNGLMTKTLVNK